MATRSTIAIKRADSKVSQLYCHWDGYIEGVGATLVNHYNSYEKVANLLMLGNLSSLGKYINPITITHSFDTPEPDVCVAYARDRGETGQVSHEYNSLDDYFQNGMSESYNYLFIDDKWTVAKSSVTNPNWSIVDATLNKTTV